MLLCQEPQQQTQTFLALESGISCIFLRDIHWKEHAYSIFEANPTAAILDDLTGITTIFFRPISLIAFLAWEGLSRSRGVENSDLAFLTLTSEPNP